MAPTAASFAVIPCLSVSVKAPTDCSYKQLQRNQVAAETRRRVLLAGAISTLSIMSPSWMPTPLPARAEGGQPAKDEEEEGVVGAIKSLLDPNEKTKSGKLLPKAYLKSAREVVKTLRESLQEDPKDNAKFRRNADAAKESIREYLGNWRGQEKIAGEESYVEIEKAIRALASFYSKAGPSAALPESVKSAILDDLKTAEEFL
ncbi:unnamed protein product [Linum tenue]|uniref:Uncharacterized protein n=1 Tax=Linum tenue TaxID=586396 RepID=A0AAV0P545_9ROSI|nr:unnamed protein product [Linum tenue]